jgi:hypothetical protein
MAKFVYVYTGGQAAATPEAQEQAMQQWGAWFGTLGGAVVDVGNPFGASSTVKAGGSASAGCPILQTGGNVEVYEAVEM